MGASRGERQGGAAAEERRGRRAAEMRSGDGGNIAAWRGIYHGVMQAADPGS